MKVALRKLLLVGCVLASAASPAAGQTGRIAHLSHGGSAATLANGDAADNFGYPISYVIQEIRRISDSTAVRRGYIHHGGEMPVNDTIQFVTHDKRAIPHGNDLYLPSCGVIQSLETIKKKYPDAVFSGFDKAQQPARSIKVLKPTPKKPSGQIQAFPKRPFQYSLWRGLAGAAALGAVGWLLGRKPGSKIS